MLSQRRIARSLVVVFLLTFVQTVVAPVLNLTTPEANADYLFDNKSQFLQWNNWTSDANHIPYVGATTNQIAANSDEIYLTQNSGSQRGFLWNTQTVSLTQDFAITALYNLGSNDAGADGLAFSLRPLNQWPNNGTSGSSSGGYQDWGSPQISVTFDTYKNGTELDNDHLNINATNSSGTFKSYSGDGIALKNTDGTNLANIEDNVNRWFTIQWLANTRTLSVWAGLSTSGTSARIYETVITSAEQDVNTMAWGWAGFTGGASNLQKISNIQYHIGPVINSSPSDMTVVTGDSVSLTTAYTVTAASPTTRWEYSTDGGVTWISTGVTTASYTFTANRSLNKRMYRFYVATTMFSSTFTNTSTPITLTVNPPPLGFETDTALVLNGSTQYARANDANSLDISDSITIEAWVYQTANVGTDWNMVVNKESSYEIGTINGVWWYGLAGASWGGVNTGVKTTLNTWQHVALTRAAGSSTAKFYVNGALVYTGTSDGAGTGQLANSVYTLTIGGRDLGLAPNNYAYFQGQIDEVRIFASDRSPTQIASDMSTYGPINTSSLRLYYDFNEGSGSTIYNRVFTALGESDLTLYNSPTWDNTKIESTTVTGPYTVKSFLRSYLTSTGGWRVPANVSAISAVVVGGGGGGGYNSGGGGSGGGLLYTPRSLISGTVSIIVGAGGEGATTSGSLPVAGFTSTFGTLSAAGGNPGGNYPTSQSGGAGVVTSTGTSGAGGAGAPNSSSSGVAGSAGLQSSITGVATNYGGGGGGGGWNASTGGGAGGVGGGGAGGVTNSRDGKSGSPNTGGGGGAGSSAAFIGGDGGSGVIIIRWISALAPTYTKPTNAFLNAGMTETFTTNVAQDSATAVLTRTFRWESTTGGANGTFSLIKQGTGVSNAAFSWVPNDTSTSGPNYLYRLIVTDSDTAGLFITDSSTAFATINKTLLMTGTSRINKAINVSKNETFTISFGTSTYRVTMTPVIPGITIDTSTITSPVIKISDTATVGTYYETLTVTDSVSASVVIPLTINVSAPPTLLNTAEIVSNDLVFNLDAGNSASLIDDSGTATTGIMWKDLSGSKADASTGAGVNTGAPNGTSCSAPTYTSANGGAVEFGAVTTNCYYASSFTGRSLANSYTVEAWFKLTSALPQNVAIISQSSPASAVPVSIFIQANFSGNLIVGFYDNTVLAERFANCPYTPTIGRWTHISGTYDGTTLKTYIDGNLSCSTNYSYTPDATLNNLGMIIGKGRAGGSASFPGFISTVRIYQKPLTATQILSNFNATKARFDNANIPFVTPTKKYGESLIDSFTATSGIDTKTVSFTTGNRSSITWDTTTVTNRITLTMQESLTGGTYYDTVTVTDALGQSTYLPLTMKVNKADSLTVTMSAGTVITYNGSQLTVYPRPTITGLKWTDTATSVSRFSSALYSESTVVPTNADTYTVRGTVPTFTLGSIDNYLGVIYDTSTAVINKARQNPLGVFMYGGVVGSPYLIWLQGGNGTGAVTESLTGVSTLSGCAVNNHYLTAVEQKQGFCEVRVVKAGDQNYYSETQTVQMYFMAYVNNQPTGVIGSGSTIGLNGKTSLTIDDSSTVRVPRIISFSKSGSTLTINGEGFGNSPVTITFERYVNAATTPTPSGGGTVIVVAIPGTAVSGPVLVITSGGRDSIDWLDIP